MKLFSAALLIVLCGGAVIASWCGLLPEWLRYGYGEVSMKPVTAGGFVVAGLMLTLMCSVPSRAVIPPPTFRSVGVLLLAIALILGAACIMYGNIVHEVCALERLFPVKIAAEPLMSLPGQASLGTAHGFLFLGFAGLMSVFREMWRGVMVWGGLVVAIGLFALLGWAFHVPLLYWYFGKLTTAMAFPTAGLFMACGALVVLLGVQPEHREAEARAE